jgi:hypothetical protein
MRRTVEWFECEHCGDKFETEAALEKHWLGHDVVYVSMERHIWKEVMIALNAAYWQGIPVPVEFIRKMNKMNIGVELG